MNRNPPLIFGRGVNVVLTGSYACDIDRVVIYKNPKVTNIHTRQSSKCGKFGVGHLKSRLDGFFRAREVFFAPLTGTSTGIFAANKGELAVGFPAERSNLHSTQLDPTVRRYAILRYFHPSAWGGIMACSNHKYSIQPDR
ncbi:predicted protein [Histoplasma mississippiense (nom. inval.)]|uniref:predicted protein n=1 Tax=Ajellomyces capsulatus (strain NAm1 / WU24) TaxID=2059318 RepID=UPI000157BF5A|nr:predicted protein [Histoplasma mississippiense (nom. inval.)]EDN06789.1 predicted protein [Histoplasma mississippiense (nom. inval.)]